MDTPVPPSPTAPLSPPTVVLLNGGTYALGDADHNRLLEFVNGGTVQLGLGAQPGVYTTIVNAGGGTLTLSVPNGNLRTATGGTTLAAWQSVTVYRRGNGASDWVALGMP